jgi:hypothetical protein
LKASNLIRVAAAALVLSTISFAAGVAGDLSLADRRTHGARVVLRIPPELPEDTPRAAPIALISTSAAAAEEVRPARRHAVARHIEPAEKPPHEQALAASPKEDPDLAPKEDEPR